MGNQLPSRVTQGTAGRILELLRRGPRTVDDLTTALDLTPSAVRAQLASLEHEGLVERRGSRRGTSKPARVYGITAQAELLLSRAYVPILTQLLHVLVRRMPPTVTMCFDRYDRLRCCFEIAHDLETSTGTQY
jgi:predicted ArsR family transcriptional regulator